MKTNRALEALNFFVADVQAGMVATSPAGALVDATHHKRALVVVAGMMTVAASGLLWVSHDYWMVAASQIATAITGAALGPTIAGITLGIVQQRGFDRQLGRNQVANHAGNALAAALSGWLGWRFGFGAVFALSAAFGILSLIAVAMIRGGAIDHDVARGLGSDGSTGESADAKVSGLRILLQCRPLIVLAAALALFHLGNAAMLPLYGLAIVAAHQGDPSAFTAETIVMAQLVMVGAATFAYRLIRWRGYWWVILVTFLALPLRGMIAASVIHQWGVWPVQALDGIGAGLQSVASQLRSMPFA
jgi:MFS family permease